MSGPLVVLLAGAVMVWWTWQTWPDPLMDYGREAYLAWQLSEGKMLYADVAHFNGPFSAYFNALALRLTHGGILGMALANGLFALLCLAMFHALLRRTTDRLAATVAALTFVLVFACPRYYLLGNYTWLCAYSHELPHGVALGVASLWCLDRYRRRRRIGWLLAMGVALGLLALTKAEPLLAGLVAAAAGFGLTLASERPSWPRLGRACGAVALGAASPLVATFLWFARRMPAADVLAWPLGYWHSSLKPEFLRMPFYQHVLGSDDVGGNVRLLAWAVLGYAVLVAAAVVVGFAARGVRRPIVPAVVIAMSAAALAAGLVSPDGWLLAMRGLPVAMAVVVVASALLWLRAADDLAAERQVVRLTMGILALALLAKMALHATTIHYGFALAMPATLVLVAALVGWVPAAVEAAGGAGWAARAVTGGVVAVGILTHVMACAQALAPLRMTLGAGNDAIRGDARAAALDQTLAEVRRRVQPEQTLLAVPDGTILNYLARRRSSLPYPQYNPLTLALWGERTVRDAFDRNPPDFIAIVHVDHGDEGARYFGRDYAVDWMNEIREQYRPVWNVGATPFESDEFGVTLWQRAAPAGGTRP